MSMGSVTVNNLNLSQGAATEVERQLLFVGIAASAPAENQGKVHAIGAQSDLDALIGASDSNLKTQIEAARANGGQNWFAAVLPLAAGTDEAARAAAIDAAVAEFSVEGIVIADEVATKAEVEALHALNESLIGKYQRRTFTLAAFRAIDDTPSTGETWSTYVSAAKAITENVAADRVCIVPLVYATFLGALAGRLCNRAVTVADTPMRVETGALVGSFATRPVDKDGVALSKAVLKDLHDNGRYCVPTWYEDYAGTYCSDAVTLAPVTSDFRVLENLRVVDKAARRVYLMAVARVGNRRLNSTPNSIAVNKTYFAKPLREMSRSVEIAGMQFPGEIKAPQEGDIVIQWPTRESVSIYMLVRPYNCPKAIEANILLDLSNGGNA